MRLKHPHTAVLLSLLIFLAGLVLAYWFALLHHSTHVSHERTVVTARLDKVRGEFNRQLDTIIHLSQGLVSLVKIQHGITEARFVSMAQETIASEPRIRNIALAPKNIIRFVYPMKGNERALNMDYLKNPDQREMVLRAIREKTTVVAGPVNLIQGGVGIISRTPIFMRDSPVSPGEPLYWGIASTVIDFDTLIRRTGLGDGTNHNIHFALRGKDGLGASGTTFWGDGRIFTRDPVLMDITLPSGSWQIAALPANGWPEFNPLRSFYFLFGCIFGLIFAILFFQLIRINSVLRQEIRERLEAENAARLSEERYRRIVETSLEGIWILNEERRTTFVNKRLADMLGYTPEEILGRRVDLFMFEEDLEDVRLRGEVRRQGLAEVFERRFRRKDKTTIWNIVSTSPLFDGQDSFTGSFAMFTDITERKLAEEALRVSEQAARRLANESELIAEIGRIISSTLNLEEVYACFAEKVREAIPFDRIAVNTVNMKNYTRTIRYVTGDMFASYGIGQVISLVGTGIEQAIQTKSSILINSKSPEDMRRKLLAAHQFGAESTMLIPLIFKDEVMGYLAVHSAQIDAYSEDDLRLAERMASQIAGAIANAQLFRERTQAEEKLQNTLDSLRKALSTTIQVMVSTIEARDPYTAGHQIRAADLARTIATEMGLSPEKIEGIRMAGSIHDIGKISIPAEILSKPTKLSEIEFSLIKEHSRKGSEMLKNVESPWPLAEIVHQHHERMDGSGYPRNLKGEEILMEARILTVADVVEAMASHRPYRPGLGIKVALDEIEKNRGIFYDTAVAGACLRLFREKGFKLEGS